MPIINRIGEFHADMTEWRRDLHAHPELSMHEARTSATVQAKLREFGVDEIITGMAVHGVVGVIRNGTSDRAIGLRADMDALAINEETGLPEGLGFEKIPSFSMLMRENKDRQVFARLGG